MKAKFPPRNRRGMKHEAAGGGSLKMPLGKGSAAYLARRSAVTSISTFISGMAKPQMMVVFVGRGSLKVAPSTSETGIT
jgi:hypothetical protein